MPKFVSWSASQGDTVDAIPAEYTAKLTRGADIGGVVVDEQGDPVPGVQVVFSVLGTAPGASHERERVTMMGHYHAEITDLQGQWHCNHVPQQFGMITYECLHPEYLPARFGSASLGSTTTLGNTYLAEAALRSGTAKVTLKPGPLVAGVVVDQAGRPVAHAKVTEDRSWYQPWASEETGNAGRFRFANTSQKDLVLTVQARDLAPLEITVHPGDQTDGLRLTLSNGAILRGRVVDDSAQPVPKAKIRVSSAESSELRFEWAAETDGQGRFEWLSAPAEVTYDIAAAGYQSQSKLSLPADGSEHVVTLRRNASPSGAIEISGTAVAADTQEPIEKFRVLTVTTDGKRTSWGIEPHSTSQPTLQVVGAEGKFAFNAPGSVLECIVEVQAKGYWPARITLDGPITNDSRLAFELKRGAPVIGSVRLSNGSPVVGAVVMLSALAAHQDNVFPTRLEEVWMKLAGQFDLSREEAARTSTDANGAFSFEPRLGMQRILITHKSGFAELPVDQLLASPTVILQPWGRVAGTLLIGDRPGTNETVCLWTWPEDQSDSLILFVYLEAKTDSEGRFAIEGVPPGEWQIFQKLRLRGGPSVADEPGPVQVRLRSGDRSLWSFLQAGVRAWLG